MQPDAYFGVQAVESADDAEDARLPRAGHADVERAGLAVGYGGGMLVGAAQGVEHAGHVLAVLATRRGELNALRAAGEQREAQLLLERLNLLADGRLRHMAQLRSSCKAERFCYGNKVLELRCAHGCS